MRVVIFIMLLLVIGCTSRPTSNIIRLDLSDRNLTAVPDSVFSLEQLEYLDLGNRSGWTIYPTLSALVDHASGDSANRITEIPKAIQQLDHLRTLKLSSLDLTALPVEIAELENLDSLDLSMNFRLSIGSALGTLKRMQGLRYLNILGTMVDQSTVDKLRTVLPETTILARFDDLKFDR